MIRLAIAKDKEKVKDYLKSQGLLLSDEDYERGTFYLLFESELCGVAITRKLTIKLNRHFLKVSIIEDIITDDPKDHDRLFLAVMDYLEHTELISFVKCTIRNYQNFNFEDIYYDSIYTFKKYDFETVDTSSLKEVTKVGELIDTYALMMRYFNGFEIRQLPDFAYLLARCKEKGRGVFGVYEEKLKAYFTMYLKEDSAFIDECVDLDVADLDKILSYALKYATKVTLKVSSYEKLERFYKVQKEKIPAFACRINDEDLLSKLFAAKTDDVRSLFFKMNRPLWLKDDY